MREPRAVALIERAVAWQGGGEAALVPLTSMRGLFTAQLFERDPQTGRMNRRAASIRQWWTRTPQGVRYRRELIESEARSLHVVDSRGRAWLQPDPKGDPIALADSPEHQQEHADLLAEVRRTGDWIDLLLVRRLLEPEWSLALAGTDEKVVLKRRAPPVPADRVRCRREGRSLDLLLARDDGRPIAVERRWLTRDKEERVERMTFALPRPIGPGGAKMPRAVLFTRGADPVLQVTIPSSEAQWPVFNEALPEALFSRPRPR